MNRLGMLALSAGLALGLLVGCSTDGEDSAGGDALSTAPNPVPAEEQAAKSGGDGIPMAKRQGDARLDDYARAEDLSANKQGQPKRESKPKKPISQENLVLQNRKLARNASLKLRVKDMDEAAADARDIATRKGGYIGSESTRKSSTRMTLVVPGTKLDSTLTELEELGKRLDRKISIEDVTDEVVDVDSRVKSQRRSVIRARALLDRAQSISEIVRVEEELADREEELESLLARQEALRGQVAMAPITLALLPTKPAPKPKPAEDDEPDGFLAGLAGGWDAFTTAMAGLATAVGAIAPFLLVLGPAALVLLWGWRRRRRKPAEVAPSQT